MQQFQNVCCSYSIFSLICFATIYSTRMYKSHFFEIPGAPRKNQSYCIFPKVPCIYRIRNVQCPDTRIFILICRDLLKKYVQKKFIFCNFSFIYFALSRLNQSECVKVFFSGNFRCSAKGAVILLLSWSTLYIEFSKCIVS